jgi:hypothetical protein
LCEAAAFYQGASDAGNRMATLSLGLFHWRGVGGFCVNRPEALRLWQLSGLDISDTPLETVASSTDSSPRWSRFVAGHREAEGSESPSRIDQTRDPETGCLDRRTEKRTSTRRRESPGRIGSGPDEPRPNRGQRRPARACVFVGLLGQQGRRNLFPRYATIVFGLGQSTRHIL